MWNACLIGLKLGDWLGHSRILHFLPSKTLGLLLLCVLGQRPFLLWSVINFAPFDWIWAEYIPILFRIIPAASVLCHIITKHQWPSATGSHACSCHHTAPPCFTDVVVCFGSWAVPSFLHTFFFPSFRAKPFIFSLGKSSLECRLWQWHVYLLESVLLLAGCCERVFLYHGEDSPIIYHCCPLWTSRPFNVAELTSTLLFCFFKNVPNCWFDHS